MGGNLFWFPYSYVENVNLRRLCFMEHLDTCLMIS